MSDRSEFIAAVKAQSFDEGRECPTCHGEGVVQPGRKIVHCRGGLTGADWDESSVIAAIEKASDVAWIDDMLGHNLATCVDGKWWRFQVTKPEPAA